MKRIICLLLVLVLCLGSFGCQSASNPNDHQDPPEMDDRQPDGDQSSTVMTDSVSGELADFALELLRQNGAEGGNTLVSPLSVLCALTMTANGAKDETLTQMENTLGMPLSMLNPWLKEQMGKIEAEGTMSMANSIWFTDKDSFTVEQDFLDFNRTNFSAEIRQLHFDPQAVVTINDWVREKTDGMIPKILEEIPEEAVMYLINALAFNGKWEQTYEDTAVKDAVFTTENGKKQDVELMNGSEYQYILSEDVQGFIKPYDGGKYGFVALLPEEGVKVGDYLQTLTGDKLMNLIAGAQNTEVITAIPKFEAEFGAELSEILQDMGMENAFDYTRADFSGIGTDPEGPLYIDQVLHKTYISLDEQGTKAAAVTSVMVALGCALDAPVPQIPQVILDRPFIYMIVDLETNYPIFIGTMMNPA